MTIEVLIKKKNFFSKAFTYQDLLKILDENHKVITTGIDFVAKEIEGEHDYTENYIVVYDQSSIGRGFSIFFNGKFVELNLNVFCTDKDVDLFYAYVDKIANYLKVNSFEEDHTKYKINEIDTLKEITKRNNLNSLNMFIKRNNSITIFGALFPIEIEKSFIQEISNLSPEQQMIEFSKYLDCKQNADIVYVRNIILNIDDKIYGVYILNQDDIHVIPLNIKSSFFCNGHDLCDQFIRINSKKTEIPTFNILFEDFKRALNFSNYPKFDESSILLELTIDEINQLYNIQHK